jgi:hypothetical protein
MSLLLLKVNSSSGGTTFGPGGTPNCLLWLRSDKIHPTSPEVVEVGGGNVVEKWIDQSGSGNDVVSTPGFEPVLIPNSFNCNGVFKDVVRFNGIDEFLWNTSFPFSGAQKFSIFIAFKAGNDDASILSIRDNETGVLTDGLSVGIQPNVFATEVETDTDKKTISRSQVYATGLVVIYEVFVDLGEASDELRIRINGSEETTLSLAGGSVKTDSNELNIGRFGTGGKYYNGDIVEVIMFGNDEETTRTTVETYLFNKWCVTPIGVGPGETTGTFWWWTENQGLPFRGDGQSFSLPTWEDSSGRKLIAAQPAPLLQSIWAQAAHHTVGAVSFESDNPGGVPYYTTIDPGNFMEALGVNHNLDEITDFSIVFLTSESFLSGAGTIFSWGEDFTNRAIHVDFTFSPTGALLVLNTTTGLKSYAINAVFPDGRQLNNGAPPISGYVLTLKILNVDLVAKTATWYSSVSTESGVTAATPVFLSSPTLDGTLDIGTTLRLCGTFPNNGIPGSKGKYFVSDMAFYNHALSGSEMQAIHDAFSAKYNTAMVPLLYTPLLGDSSNEVHVPFNLTLSGSPGHIGAHATGTSFFRKTSPISDGEVQPTDGTNPLFVGILASAGGGSLASPIFTDTVPGPGTYFYRAAINSSALTDPPIGVFQFITPPSNEVSIVVP